MSAVLEQAKALRQRMYRYTAKRQVTEESRERVQARLSELQAEEKDLINRQFNLRGAYQVLRDMLAELAEPRKKTLTDTVNKALRTAVPKHRYQMTIRDVHHEGLGMIANFFLEDSAMGRDLDPRHQNGEAVKQLISFVVLLTFLVYARKAPFLLLDEALGGINARKAQEIGEIIHRLALESNFQVFLVNQNAAMHNVIGARYMRWALDSNESGTYISQDRVLEREGEIDG